MTTEIFIILGIIVLGGAAAGFIWFIRRSRRSGQTEGGAVFRWRYIVAPIILFFISIIAAAVFYPQLPAEMATHFAADGTPDGWLERELVLVLLLVPQLLLAVVSLVIAWGITRLRSLFLPEANTLVKPEHILLFMGNAVAIPQLVLFFAMLHIFSYNAYQTYILPLWLLLLLILGLATIALVALLVLVISRARRQSRTQPNENAQEQQ